MVTENKLRTKAAYSFLIAIVCAAVCALRLKLELHGVDMFTHDVFALLDGGWRMVWGQKPHVDFYTPLGLGAYLPTYVGLLLAGTAKAFGVGQAVTAMTLALWAILLGYRRLKLAPYILFCLLIVLTAAGVSNMGFATISFTPAMTYNRHCYALLMLMLLESLVPVFGTKSSSLWGGISTGLALTLMLFTKISFFLGAGALVVLLLPCCRQTRPRLNGLFLGFSLSLTAIAAYFHFDLRPMLRDLYLAARAKHIHFRFYLLDDLMRNAAICVLLGIGAWIVLKERALALGGAAIALFGTGFVLTCYEPSGFPLLAVLGIVVLNRLDNSWRSASVFLAVAAALPSVVDIGNYSFGLVAAAVRPIGEETGCRALDQQGKPFLAVCRPDWGYVDVVRDGLQLLQAHRAADESVCSLDFSNPFAVVTGIPPMKGGTTNQQYETTFSDRAYPSAEKIFGNASLVMLPKLFSDDSLNMTVDAIYGPFLHSHYHSIGESQFWTLYHRI